MKFVAEKCTPPDLNAGDLFSTSGPAWWDHVDPLAVGQKVFVRTEAPIPEGQEELVIFRVVLELDEPVGPKPCQYCPTDPFHEEYHARLERPPEVES